MDMLLEVGAPVDIDREAQGLEHWPAFWPIHAVTLWISFSRQAGDPSFFSTGMC